MRVTFLALGSEQLAVSQLADRAPRRPRGRPAFSAALFHDRYNLFVPRLAPYFDDRQQAIDAIVAQRPDVLACPALTGTYRWMLGVAEEAKLLLPDLKVVFGGVHASAVPDRVIADPHGTTRASARATSVPGDPARDRVARRRYADREHAIPASRRQPRAGSPSGFIQDLDSLPPFDKTLWEDHIRIGDFYLTMASRGCPYRCTFCFNNFFANLPEEKRGKVRPPAQRRARDARAARSQASLQAALRRFRGRRLHGGQGLGARFPRPLQARDRRAVPLPDAPPLHGRRARAVARRRRLHVDPDRHPVGGRFAQVRHREAIREDRARRASARGDEKGRPAREVRSLFDLPSEPEGAQEVARSLYTRHAPYRIQTYWTNLLPGTEMVDQVLAADWSRASRSTASKTATTSTSSARAISA